MPPRKSPTTLTPREARFCEEYLVDLHVTNAAIRAGYSPKSAQEIGSETLSRPIVQARVQKLMEKRAAATGSRAAKVLQELEKQAFIRPSAFLVPTDKGALKGDFSRMTRDELDGLTQVDFDEAGAVAKVKIDRIPALTLLGRHHGLWKEDPVLPPPPNNEQRKTIINVLVKNLEAKAHAVHVEVTEEPRQGALIQAKPNGKGNGHG